MPNAERLSPLLLLIYLVVFSFSGYASTTKPTPTPTPTVTPTPTPTPTPRAITRPPVPVVETKPIPPTIPGTAHLLIEMHTGKVLAESNPDKRLEPASLTKIMTAHITFRELTSGRIKLSDQVMISKKAWRTSGSRTFVEVDKPVPLEILLKGLIIQSGNDASVAIAEHIAGSEEGFAELMNAEAKRLGMLDSHFMNATGLPDPNHYTTARDIAKLTAATIREYPDYYKWYSIKEYLYNGIKQQNRNRLLWRDDAVDGVKTGHHEAAGFCLVASALKDNTRLISVVLGMASDSARAEASQSLLNFGFRFFEAQKLFDANKELARIKVWKGKEGSLPLGPAEDAYVALARGKYDKLQARVMLEQQVMAPISRGTAYGYLSLQLENAEVGRVPLVALTDIPEAGFIGGAVDSFLLLFK